MTTTDVGRRRRRLIDFNKTRENTLLPVEEPKPSLLPPKAPEHNQPQQAVAQYKPCVPSLGQIQTQVSAPKYNQPLQPVQYRSSVPSLDQIPIKISPGLPINKNARMYDRMYGRNRTVDTPITDDAAEGMSRKSSPRRARQKLGAAKDLVAASKKSREEFNINPDQSTQMSCINSVSGYSVQSTCSKSTAMSTIILTPKKAAMIDAVKRNRLTKRLMSLRSITPPSQEFLPTRAPSPLRGRSPRTQSSGKPRSSSWASRMALRRSSSELFLSKLRPIERVRSVSRNLRRSASSDTRDKPESRDRHSQETSDLERRNALRRSSSNVFLSKLKPSERVRSMLRNSTRHASPVTLFTRDKPESPDQNSEKSSDSNKCTPVDTTRNYHTRNFHYNSKAALEWESPRWQNQQIRIQDKLNERLSGRLSLSKIPHTLE